MLPQRCITRNEPEVITIKMVPMPERCNPRKHHRDDKRAVNKAVDKIIRGSNSFDAMNANSIYPTDEVCFEENGDLSPRGHMAYWAHVNMALQEKDNHTYCDIVIFS